MGLQDLFFFPPKAQVEVDKGNKETTVFTWHTPFPAYFLLVCSLVRLPAFKAKKWTN